MDSIGRRCADGHERAINWACLNDCFYRESDVHSRRRRTVNGRRKLDWRGVL
jgi:hypothetical protein